MIAFTAIHMVFLVIYYSDKSVIDNQKNNVIQFVYQILIITMVLFQYYNTLRSQKLVETEEHLKNLKWKNIIHMITICSLMKSFLKYQV